MQDADISKHSHGSEEADGEYELYDDDRCHGDAHAFILRQLSDEGSHVGRTRN